MFHQSALGHPEARYTGYDILHFPCQFVACSNRVAIEEEKSFKLDITSCVFPEVFLISINIEVLEIAKPQQFYRNNLPPFKGYHYSKLGKCLLKYIELLS